MLLPRWEIEYVSVPYMVLVPVGRNEHGLRHPRQVPQTHPMEVICRTKDGLVWPLTFGFGGERG